MRRISILLFTFVTFLVSVAWPQADAPKKQPTIITFDPPGSTLTSVQQINPSGTIVGSYQDAVGVYHSCAIPKGKIISYDAPDAGKGPFQDTSFVSINPSGELVGQTLDSNYVFRVFLLTFRGFTKFDAPNAGTGTHQGTFGWNINPRGEIAGAILVRCSGRDIYESNTANMRTSLLAATTSP